MLQQTRTLIPRIKEKAELTLLKPPIDITCELISTDKDGRVIGRRKFRSHSFVANFIAQLYTMYNQSTTATLLTTGKDIGGTTRTFKSAPSNGVIGSSGGVGGTGANIVVGTGTTAPAFGDNVMGGFAGRVLATIGSPVYAATSKFTITGTISFTTATTINEVGIDTAVNWDANNVTTSNSFLHIHDNVSGGFAVSAGGAITVVYTISVTT